MAAPASAAERPSIAELSPHPTKRPSPTSRHRSLHALLEHAIATTGDGTAERTETLSVTDELMKNARTYAENFNSGDLPMPPARGVAVVTCMDARINPYGLLGLNEGDAHVIRNAGGVVTDDAIRSLAISQRLLGTNEIILIHHTDCGMLTFTDDEFKAQIETDTGLRPEWAAESFRDPANDIKQSLARISANPFIDHKDNVRGFVYSVSEGTLTKID